MHANKSKLLGFTILLLLCVYSSNAYGGLNAGQFAFRKYQVDHGLSENTVQAILQDSLGFMWFGTKDGLNRFDGKEFKVFMNNPGNPGSLGNNFIRDLYQHTNKKIWVGTDKGIYIYHSTNESFERFSIETHDRTIIESAVTSICFDGDHSLWFGTMTQGAFRFNMHSRELTQYATNSSNNTIKSDLIWRIYKDLSGTIWLGSRSGLSRYNKETDTFFTYESSPKSNGLEDSEILSIFEDSDGELWVGTWSGGLARLNRSTNTFKTWFSEEHPVYISHIRAIFEYDKNQLLIGSDDGLYLFNKSTENYRRIDDPRDINSLSDQNVYSISKDTEGGLWVGTYFGGVNYVSPISRHIEHYYPSYGANSMSGKAVSQFFEDEVGNIWIATEDGGLNYFDTKSKKFTVFLPKENKSGISYHNIHSLLLVNNQLWIGTFSRGLDVLDIQTNTFKNYTHDPYNEKTINDNCIFTLYRTSSGDILIGTPYGLSRYNPEHNNFDRFPEIQDFVYKIKEDPLGQLWIATYGNGIFRYNPSEDAWHHYAYMPSAPNSIGHNKVIDVYLDNQHRLWFATEGRGIYKYNYDTDDFTAINETHGLPNNVVYGILDDKYGNIWASTNKGISKINPSTHEIKTYTRSDGLQSDQFNYRSSYKASGGTFYFGGINGFNVFNPDNLNSNEKVPPVHITNIELMDIETPELADTSLFSTFQTKQKITLKHNQASIRISFISLSFLAPEKNQYLYTLENYNNRWIEASEVTSATYINLPPGKYTFRVKGSNNDGLWNDSGDHLDIEVLPPLWKTIYAIILYYLIFISALLLAFRHFSHLAKKKHKEKLDIFQIEKEKEIYNSKINFFTSVAHEIRTPVSLIKAPLECVINSNEGSLETKENLNVIERNTERLIQLINQLLDFRKIDENIYTLKLRITNINELITETCYRFKPTADQANIELGIKLPENTISTSVDKEAITKIISNLLTNALKNAKSFVNLTLSDEKEYFRITISDNGEGIAKEYREKIFEPFYQIEQPSSSTQKTGTGIGLALTRQLVARHKGEILVKDNQPHGCIFEVSIPINLNETRSELNEKDILQLSESTEILTEENGSGNNLLIVEDNADLLSFMQKNMKHEYGIFTAKNGREAIEQLNSNAIDIVISDVMMPIMDGVELVNEIKQNEQFSHIPIILLSARTNIETKIEGLESGADCYIEKPFSIEFLKAQINSLIKNRLAIHEKFANSPFIPFGSITNNKKDEEFLSKLNAEIENNLTDSEYSIEKLSIELSMSRSNLQRKIKAMTGMTPNDYIRVYRLKKAARLLQISNNRINEICYLVGFNNPSYFSKCFQKQFGILPKEFAKNQSTPSKANI